MSAVATTVFLAFHLAIGAPFAPVSPHLGPPRPHRQACPKWHGWDDDCQFTPFYTAKSGTLAFDLD
jgi:hypothetical protein